MAIQLDHLQYVPLSWRSPSEWIRKSAVAINGILSGGPFPRRWNDYVGSLSAAKVAGANQPTWSVYRDSLYGYAFADNTTEELWITIHVLHDYALNTKIYPHIHWGCATTNTGTVRWGIEYSAAKGHGQQAFPASTTVYVEQDADGTQYKHYIAEVSDDDAIAATNLEPDSLILFRIFRDGGHANDDLTGDAYGFFVDCHYEANRRGGTIYKAPNFYES